MIKALLDKVGNVLEKEFLFASFLPALLFSSALAATFASVIGFQATFAWLGTLGPVEKVTAPAAAGVAIVIFAYVLSGTRPLIARLWSGNVSFILFRPIANLMRIHARRQYLKCRQQTRATSRWTQMQTWFCDEADKLWDQPPTGTLTRSDRKRIWRNLRRLEPSMTVDDAKLVVTTYFLTPLSTYGGESLSEVYQYLNDLFREWHAVEQQRINDAQWKLDRSFGPLESVHATRLGNIVESYTAYSFTRYNIEPEVFWPHLQTLLSDKLRAALSEARTMFDFALTMATLGLAYTILAVFGGPWLYLAKWMWVLHALAGIVVSYLAYRTSVAVAVQFGDVFRASFDLHRLELLKAFHRPTPPTLSAERAQWRELSQLVLYAREADFELVVDAPPPPPGAPS